MAFCVYPADFYETSKDICLITCYFNPSHYKSKYINYLKFREKIQYAGLKLLTVECVFGDSNFNLPASSDVLQIRSTSVMWQKERLLNLAIQSLPVEVKKVAWLDCDILFSNPRWAIETSKLLDEFPVVQPFMRVFRLPRGHEFYNGEAESWRSFGYVVNLSPDLIKKGNFHQHGHTGLAWAARREILEKHSLYDSLISGSADHMMAHAMCGDFASSCIKRIMSNNNKLLSHFLQWGKGFYEEINGKIGYTQGTVIHLWHGETENRKYITRHDELMKYDFDPGKDIRIGDSGTWEWSSNKPELHQWAINYFGHRKEDGEAEYCEDAG
ncbi:MAG: hypothetical protein O9324_19735 [Microcystis sp. LE19-84.1B]|jgi:hypothetical protein|uniref:hypothetical protein n=1 Tax=Microcystis sp. LE19-84.1B TaxID=3016438 RepID=UPI001DC12D3C|nr:hypothetical protein [Microcystis sp. LE19-84.1B]MCZ8226118.1 hypothetical protein [Microcystis sp. LE19-84.1B]NCS31437.1 hypothetical protein [Microcystis aeruginosa F13-15]